MQLKEFFDTLGNLPVNWCLMGDAIRSFDAGCPSECYSPIEVVCYYKGGTVSWTGGKLHRPNMIGEFFQQGKLLGLSDPDTHALFRATDNHVTPFPGWDELTTTEQKDFAKQISDTKDAEKEYNDRRLRHLRDYNIRQRLLEVCKPSIKFKKGVKASERSGR